MASFNLAPIFNAAQLFSANGVPLNAGQIFTYAAGTTTPTATYTTNLGTVSSPNPIVLGADGRVTNEIWIPSGYSYKFVLMDALNNTIATYDNLFGINDPQITFSEWIASGYVPVFISANSFSVVGNATNIFQVNRRVQITVNLGILYGTINSSVFSAGITTCVISLDSGVLDNTISSVNVALLSANNLSLPAALNNVLSINGGAIAFRNHFINGGMQVAQGVSVALSAAFQYGSVDMIQATISGGTSITGNLLQGASNSFVSGNYAAISGASWTTGQAQWLNRIEAKNSQDVNGKTITISCKVFHDTGANRGFQFAIRKPNSADNFNTITAINAGFGGGQVTTGLVTQISGAVTLGATDAVNGLEIVVFDTAANTVVNKNYYIGDFQLETGNSFTAFEFRDYGFELAKSQRYFEPAVPVFARGIGNAGGFIETPAYFKVSKRVVPTLAPFGTIGTANVTTETPVSISTEGFRYSITCGAGALGTDTYVIGRLYQVSARL